MVYLFVNHQLFDPPENGLHGVVSSPTKANKPCFDFFLGQNLPVKMERNTTKNPVSWNFRPHDDRPISTLPTANHLLENLQKTNRYLKSTNKSLTPDTRNEGWLVRFYSDVPLGWLGWLGSMGYFTYLYGIDWE